jgi:transcriptional regulator with XRE-family HTH domain
MCAAKANLNLKFEEIVPKMMSAMGAKTQTDLAEYLGISPQALSSFSRRGTIPPGLVMAFALKKGIPVEEFIKDIPREKIPTHETKSVEPPRIQDRRKLLKLRRMIEIMSRADVTADALPELIIDGLPNILPMIIRQRFIETHGLYF